jgi:hypothetical protein
MQQKSLTSRAVALRAPLLVVICLAALSVAGCMAPYDQPSDKTIGEIQQKLDQRFDALQANTSPQVPPAQFYPDVKSDIQALRLRTEARGEDPSLKKQAAILDEIDRQLDSAAQLEGAGQVTPAAWKTVQTGVGTNVKGFLAVELARKAAP